MDGPPLPRLNLPMGQFSEKIAIAVIYQLCTDIVS